MDSIHKYSLKNASGLIQKDGVDTICPFGPRIPIPPKFAGGDYGMMTFPCSIACPMCNIVNYESPNVDSIEVGAKNIDRLIVISCGGSLIRERLHAPDKKIT